MAILSNSLSTSLYFTEILENSSISFDSFVSKDVVVLKKFSVILGIPLGTLVVLLKDKLLDALSILEETILSFILFKCFSNVSFDERIVKSFNDAISSNEFIVGISYGVIPYISLAFDASKAIIFPVLGS